MSEKITVIKTDRGPEFRERETEEEVLLDNLARTELAGQTQDPTTAVAISAIGVMVELHRIGSFLNQIGGELRWANDQTKKARKKSKKQKTPPPVPEGAASFFNGQLVLTPEQLSQVGMSLPSDIAAYTSPSIVCLVLQAVDNVTRASR